MVFSGALNNFNSYCQEKTAKWKQSFSPSSRSSAASPLNSSDPDRSPSSSSTGQSMVSAVQQVVQSTALPNGVAPQQLLSPLKTTLPAEQSLNESVAKMIDGLSQLNCHEPVGRRRSSSGDRRKSEETREHLRAEYGMSPSEFRRRGRQMVDYIADYIENIHNRRVVPSIEPGYLQELIPPSAPIEPESYEKVMHDFESYIMPGVTHWQHPRFHAYFPAGNSFPSILADMLSDALGCMGFSWAACPAMTELEMIVLQWFGQMIGLPKEFLPFTDNANGGGVIQGSASECNFVALLAARFEIMRELRQRFPFVEEGLLMSKLIAYCSKEAHSSVEKAAMIGMVKLRILETDSKFRLRGDTLQAAITEDRQLGLIPFFVSTTLGTTSVCSFDMLSEIGPVCSANDLWLHVDAAYAGAAFVCPEFRYLMNGIEHAMSFNTNPNKWMLVNFDCSAMWVKDRFKLTQALVVDPLYLQHSWMDKAIDYRHWGIPLSRRFRSLKLWFVIRMYGVEGIQKYIREHVRLAKKFEALLRADDHFEIVGEAIVGLVCFRLKASDETNQNLLTKLNSSGRIHMVPASLNERFVIRFCVCAEHASDRDILVAYDIIKQASLTLLYEPMPEPIAENYELEQLEEKQYEQMNKAASMDSQSIHSSQRSLNNRNSIESTGSQQLTVAPGVVSASNSTTTPPSSAGVVLPTQTMSEDFPFTNDRRRFQSTLKEKRSFLVRMVSDPKCYNPKIVRHLNMRSHKQMSQEMFRDRALREAIEHGSQQTRSSRYGNGFSSKYSQFSVDNASDDDEYVTTIAPEPTGLQTPM